MIERPDLKQTLGRLLGPAEPEVGCDACFEELDRYVEAPDMRIVSVTAEDDRVAVEVEGSGKMRSGFDYFNTYHMLFRVRGGKIASCRNHQDINHIRELMEFEGNEVRAPRP